MMEEIKRLFNKIMAIRKAVKIGEGVMKSVSDPIEIYFKVAGSAGSLAKVADPRLQEILKVCLETRAFADSFQGKLPGRWKDAEWLIENLTQGGVGRRQQNQQGIAVMTDLISKIDAVVDVTKAADGLSDAVVASLYIDIKGVAEQLTSLAAANPMVAREIKTMNQATRSKLSAFKVNVNQAIACLQRM